jgi:hypothetical protein
MEKLDTGIKWKKTDKKRRNLTDIEVKGRRGYLIYLNRTYILKRHSPMNRKADKKIRFKTVMPFFL